MGGNTQMVNRQWLLKRRPHGLPDRECYQWSETALPELADGEVLLRNLYASLDPAMRGWMDSAPSYLPPIAIGAPVRATTIARVVGSRAPEFAAGDLVTGLNALEDYSVAGAGSMVSKLPANLEVPLTAYLGVLGAVGLTAYFGFLEVGLPKRGETVLVSGAAGAVGSLVGQIARIHGCRVVGIAGGPAKCAWLVEECGFDSAIDYKGPAAADMRQAVRDACPEGVDIYFDNVGGELLDSVLMNINERCRIVLCGMISAYNATDRPAGPRNLWQLIVKRARMEGMLIRDYFDRFPEGAAAMLQWIKAGRIRYREHIEHGLENAPDAFLRLFSGEHQGKLILDIAGDEARA